MYGIIIKYVKQIDSALWIRWQPMNTNCILYGYNSWAASVVFHKKKQYCVLPIFTLESIIYYT